MTDMRHLNYLEAVTRTDVECIRQKESTYKGSWKSQGGKNAWAMIRRKIDRLMIMLGEPTPPAHFNIENVDDTISAVVNGSRLPGSQQATAEILGYLRDAFTAGDIFAKIEEDLDGADGSVLAEIRDLRRYLILVETEIVARHERPAPMVRPDVDESRHASEFPWRLNARQHATIHERIPAETEAFWTKQAPNVWTLDPYVDGSLTMPRELNGLYIPDDGGWRVNINMVPPSVRDIFPSLHLERNFKEHSELPGWQQCLYTFINEKMVLTIPAWHAENNI
jgi:hypothetical protein